MIIYERERETERERSLYKVFQSVGKLKTKPSMGRERGSICTRINKQF